MAGPTASTLRLLLPVPLLLARQQAAGRDSLETAWLGLSSSWLPRIDIPEGSHADIDDLSALGAQPLVIRGGANRATFGTVHSMLFAPAPTEDVSFEIGFQAAPSSPGLVEYFATDREGQA